ncbi:phage head closure protein [Burkholderia sola]|uniref:phage head closure protein n=1 Tax=Burkholderia TaxID=32008 RepID=UPI001AE31D56|nr:MULTISPECIES: phage head closure protein [Burkholderia]MBP0714815.1 phage head closure protein [Burkholderia sp. AcTa6-5]MCE4125759.1 phage head closure protein [Burkholderia cepacia]
MPGVNSYLVPAGRLRHVLSFQQKSQAQDALLQPQNVWTEVFKCRGEVSPISGYEKRLAQGAQSEVTHMISVRYRPELQVPKNVAAMRVVFGTRIFDLTDSMNQDERNCLVMIQAREGINNG